MKIAKKALALKLSEKLKAVRNSKNLTQEYVADQIGIHLTSYQRYEGQNPPLIKLDILLKILNLYKVTLEDF